MVGLTSDELESKKLAICTRHFSDGDFNKPGDRQTRLNAMAVPKPSMQNENSTSGKISQVSMMFSMSFYIISFYVLYRWAEGRPKTENAITGRSFRRLKSQVAYYKKNWQLIKVCEFLKSPKACKLN